MSRRSKGGGVPISLFSFQDLITSLSGILILLVLLMAVQVALRKAIPVESASVDVADVDVNQLESSVKSLESELAAMSRSMAASASRDSIEAVGDLTKAERELRDAREKGEQAREEKSTLEARLAVARQREASSKTAIEPLKKELEALKEQLAKAINDNKLFYIPENGTLKTPILVECSRSAIRIGYISKSDKPVILSADKAGIHSFEKQIAQYSPSREYFVFVIKPSGADYWDELAAIASDLNFDFGFDALEEGKSIGFGNERL